MDGKRAETSKTAESRPNRMHFIDNLRWLVIVMVVLVHVDVTYGSLGRWYYREGAPLDWFSRLLFGLYGTFSQAFFMGLLYLVAGYFVPGAYDRKGFRRFVLDRCVRLGVPTAVFMLVLHPLTAVIMERFAGKPVSPAVLLEQYWKYIASLEFLSESGPLWFALALLAFSVVYAVVRLVAEGLGWPAGARLAAEPAGDPVDTRLAASSEVMRPRARPAAEPPTASAEARALPTARSAPVKAQAVAGRAAVTHGRVAAFVLFLAAVTFLVRFGQPIGTAWYNMQLCFFPQYVLLFIFGLWAARSDFLCSVPWSFGWTWLRLALFVGIPYWAILIPLGGALSGNEAAFYGGMRWQAAAYALWEAFFAVGVCLGLVVVFRERFDSRTRLSGFLSDNAFGVYVFHAPILVTISLALRPLSAPPLLKAVVVSIIAVPSCFLFSALIRRVPGCRRLFS